MRRYFRAVSAALLMTLLAGCSTDALTPPAEVPGANRTSQVTQSDQQTDLAQNRDDKPMIDSEPDQTATLRAPQNTLEAQARALESGADNPSETRVAQTTGNLGANLYKSDAETTQVTGLYTAQTAKGSIRFLPIIGAPVQAVTPLSKELGSSARGNGLTIKSSSDQTAEHVLKGYLSAFADGDNVTVVYVWDVLDNAGGRLHRIQGKESVPGRGSDAWAAVPATTMQEIGVETIAEYMKWKQAQG